MDRNIFLLFSLIRFRQVVPYVGTWIEMYIVDSYCFLALVVPYVGTWIEIFITYRAVYAHVSFPTWERG